MALVYRLISVSDSIWERAAKDDFVVSSGVFGRVKTLEKEFYELGYLEFSKSVPLFKIDDTNGILNTLGKHPECDTKGFFLFPQDALKAALCCNLSHYQSNEAIWVCEYNIPDYILRKYLGFGYYAKEALPEFRIPINELVELEDATIETSLSSSMINELRHKHQINIDTYLDTPHQIEVSDPSLTSYVDRLNKIRSGMRRVLSLFGKDYVEKSFNAGLNNVKAYFPSKTITHRSFLISEAEVSLSRDTIIKKSNGILEESVDSWEKYYRYKHEFDEMPNEWKEYILKNILNSDYSDKKRTGNGGLK